MDMLFSVLSHQLNNREITVIIWLFILFAWLMSWKTVRKSFHGVFTILLHRQIVTILLLMVIYVLLLVLGLERVGLWYAPSHLKDTVIWLLVVGFAMIVNVSDVSKDEKFFGKAIRDAIKLTIVLEFVIGLYPFSLPVELLLVPFVTLLVMALAIAEMKQEYQAFKKVLEWLLALIGILLIWHSMRSLISDADFVVVERLTEMLLPALLTVLFLPFVYFLALYSAYESVFLRLNIWNRDSTVLGYAKRRIFLRFGLNLSKLTYWSKQNPILKVSSKQEVLEIVGRTNKPTTS
jgi:hypothetical protein